jgi:hypothetical protein
LRAAKVVAVLSTAAQKKPGVLDEIDLAVRVERSSGLNRFVLPVRLDELSHSDVRANLARRNIIDFRENWASGLHSLLSVLERDGVPRSNGNAEALSRWVMDRFLQQNTIVAKTERLISNWLRIARLPEFIFLHNVSAPVERIDTIIRSLTLASFRYLRLIGSFSTAEDLQQAALPDVVLSETYRIKLDDFIRGKAPELPGLPRWEANKLTIRLLRQAWDLNMEQRGLHSFETASGYLAWYMPKGFLDGDRVEFQDDGGKKRRKSLVGWSERRKVFWHFAVEARPVLGECPHFVLKPHVIFTPNGKSAVESKERMHLLRRQFCRSWWNDRWRDLLIAFVTWLSRTEGCALVVGRTSSIQLDSKLMSIISPVSVAVDQNLPMVVGEQEDELDVGDDIEFFEELAASALEDGERKAGA